MKHAHAEKKIETQPKIAVLTFSDTRNEKNDESGKIIHALLSEHDYQVTNYHIIKDNAELIHQAVINLVEKNIDLIICNGGTGFSKTDCTIQTITPLFEKTIAGFGELFRYLSFVEVSSAAMLSNAVAGIIKNTAIFLLPGSPKAVRLGMEKLIIPEIQHLLWLLNA